MPTIGNRSRQQDRARQRRRQRRTEASGLALTVRLDRGDDDVQQPPGM